MAWRTLPLAVFLIFQVQGVLSNLLGMTTEEIAIIKQIKEEAIKIPTHANDFYQKVKDFLAPELQAILPIDDPQEAGKFVFETVFQVVGFLEDDDKLREALEWKKGSPHILKSKQDEFIDVLVNLLKKCLADKFSAEGEEAVRKILKGVFEYVNS